jgi:meso-butanediol dehydrogenase/(S,S)-butanediol dehydrogenase/diacetyl reductase
LPEGLNFELMGRYAGLRGMGEPEDLVELLLFLASPRAKAVHGTCFVADRGVSTG